MRNRALDSRRAALVSENLPVELGNLVVDKELVDESGRRAGKVDDLLLEVGAPGLDGIIPPPECVALVSGPFALAENLPRWVQALTRWLYHALGVANPRPVAIPWDDILAIDVVVHVTIHREATRLESFQDAIARKIIQHLPGAFIGCDEEERLYAATLPPDRGPARSDQ